MEELTNRLVDIIDNMDQKEFDKIWSSIENDLEGQESFPIDYVIECQELLSPKKWAVPPDENKINFKVDTKNPSFTSDFLFQYD